MLAVLKDNEESGSWGERVDDEHTASEKWGSDCAQASGGTAEKKGDAIILVTLGREPIFNLLNFLYIYSLFVN